MAEGKKPIWWWTVPVRLDRRLLSEGRSLQGEGLTASQPVL